MADAVEEIERDGGNRAVKDLFAGAVGGVAQVLIGELSWHRGASNRRREREGTKRKGGSMSEVNIPEVSGKIRQGGDMLL